jgi:hypothetical protein
MLVLVAMSSFVRAENLNSVEKEVIVTVDGKSLVFKKSGRQSITIGEKDVEIRISYGEYKLFDNYGISFQLPAKASAYLSESDDESDIWNIDYHDSVFLVFVFKNAKLEITDELVMSQLKAISKNMGMTISDKITVKYENSNIDVSNVIGKLGEYDFLVEEFGFTNGKNSFLVFGYAPLDDVKSRKVNNVYSEFKDLLFKSLKY